MGSRVRRLAKIRQQAKVCRYCGIGLVHERGRPDSATVDHKTPLSRGGDYRGRNLVAACLSCNSIKGDMTIEEFFQKYPTTESIPRRGSPEDQAAIAARAIERARRRIAVRLARGQFICSRLAQDAGIEPDMILVLFAKKEEEA